MRHATSSTSSIRDQLERDARRLYPNLHRRLARRHPSPPKRSLRWQDRTLLIMASLLMLALLVRGEVAHAQENEQVFGIEWSGGVETALDTSIGIDITGMIARAEVTQVFINRGSDWAEAVYRFPLPDGAAVDQLRIEVGNRVLVGEIQEKQSARRIYQQARDNGQTTTLVEQQKHNQFETRLANIAPGEEIRITIGFLSNVIYRDGQFSFRFPMTFTPRGGGENQRFQIDPTPRPMLTSLSAAESEPGYRLNLGVSLQSGLKLSRIDSSFHDVDIHPTPDGYHVFLNEDSPAPDRVFELTWAPEFGTSPEASLTTWDDGDYVYSMLMLVPPLEDSVSDQPREVIFVIDTSGSMDGESLVQARAALLEGLSFLGDDDLFNIIQFNSNHETLFEYSAMPLSAELEIAGDYINSLVANGGTNMGPALDAAMNLPGSGHHLRQIVFITDGSVGNEHDLLLQIGEDLGESRLFTVSIGSAPNTWFMNKSAIVGRGSHTQIGQLNSVESEMAALWSRIQSPALMDICVDWGMDAEYFPEVIPDLYAGEPLWLFARMSTEPSQVSVCGEFHDSPWELQAQPLRTEGSETLATLWARNKVESLEDSRLFGTDPEWIRAAVTDLALDYGLLTTYTSLVAVDQTPTRSQDQALRHDNIPSLMPAGSNATGFAPTAAGWQIQVLLSFLTLAIASGMFFFGTGQFGPRVPGTRQPMARPTPPRRVADTA